MELRVKRIHPEARLPVYGHPGDAGLDLFSVVDHDLRPGDVFAVPTGIQIAVPAGHVGLVWDKSGISLKVVLINLGPEPFAVRKGLKIAQLLVQPVAAVAVAEADSLDDTSRGQGGF